MNKSFFKKIIFLLASTFLMLAVFGFGNNDSLKKPKNAKVTKDGKEYLTIEDALEYLYNDEMNSFIVETVNTYRDKNKVNRRVRNVLIEGEFLYLSNQDLMTIGNVKVGEKTYKEIYVPYVINSYSKISKDERMEELSYLKKGDKVSLFATIIKPTDVTVGNSDIEWGGLHPNKFYLLNPYHGEEEDNVILNLSYTKDDELLNKYKDKEKTWDYGEMLNDILKVSDNFLKEEKIFKDIKFKAVAKCVDKIKRPSYNMLLEFEIKNEPKKEEIDYKNVGKGINTYVEGKSGRNILEANAFFASYGKDEEKLEIDFEKYKRKDFKEQKFTLSFEMMLPDISICKEDKKEKDNLNDKKNVYDPSKDAPLNFDGDDFYTDEQGEVEEDYDENLDEELGSVYNPKVLGRDEIELGDFIYFGGKNKYRVIKVDPYDENKMLIFRHYEGYAETSKFSKDSKCTWHDSIARETLNTIYLNRFTEDEDARIYVTKNSDNLISIKDVTDKTSYDKFFVLSKDEFTECELFIDEKIEKIDRSIVRTQEYTTDKIIVYRNGQVGSYYGHFGGASALDFDFEVHPAAWINVSKDFVRNPATTATYQFKK